MSIEVRVREEIEALHAFFVEWFSGALAENAFDASLLPRLAPDLVFIPPAGRLLGHDDLVSSIRKGYATNAEFRVQIRNVRVQREFGSHVLATYEEWQRNALASEPPDNGRLATVLFGVGERLQWQHIHETWLPEEIMRAGPYDF